MRLDGHRGLQCVVTVQPRRELDFLDVGAPIQPAGVVPVVVKSLAFAS